MQVAFGSGFRCTSDVWLQLQCVFIYLMQKREEHSHIVVCYMFVNDDSFSCVHLNLGHVLDKT